MQMESLALPDHRVFRARLASRVLLDRLDLKELREAQARLDPQEYRALREALVRRVSKDPLVLRVPLGQLEVQELQDSLELLVLKELQVSLAHRALLDSQDQRELLV